MIWDTKLKRQNTQDRKRAVGPSGDSRLMPKNKVIASVVVMAKGSLKSQEENNYGNYKVCILARREYVAWIFGRISGLHDTG